MAQNGAYAQANPTGNELFLAAQSQGTPPQPTTVNVLGFNMPPKLLLASLPAVTAANQGWWAYVIDGCNTGEATGAGTGCLCTVNSAGVWCAVWSGVQVTN